MMKAKRKPARSRARKLKSVWKPGSYGHVSQDRIFEPTGGYLMHNFPFFFVSKWGISDEVLNRVKNVSDTTPGLVFCMFSLKLLYGYNAEQFVHSVYYLQNWQRVLSLLGLESLWQGSGETEWFLNFSPIVGTSFLVVCWLFGFDVPPEAFWLAYFNPVVWLDGLLWLLLFWALKIIFIGVFVFGVFYWVAH